MKATCYLVLMSFWCFGACALAQTDEASQLDGLRQQMAALQSELDKDLAARSDTLGQLSQLDRESSELQRQLRTVDEQLRAVRIDLLQLQEDLKELESSVRDGLATLSVLLIRGYPLTRTSGIELLLSQETARLSRRMMGYHRLLTESYMESLEALGLALNDLNTTQHKVSSENLRLEHLSDQRAVALQEVTQNQSRKTQVLAQITNSIENKEIDLATLLEDEQRLLSILALADQSDTPSAPELERIEIGSLQGELPMPVDGVIQTRFGANRVEQGQWRGWIIETQTNSPILAIASGRVVYSDWLRGYGLLLIIDHQDEIYSLYAHTSALFFEVGDWVETGEMIALAGQPTRLDGSATHGVYFELRQQGQPVDPDLWIDQTNRPRGTTKTSTP
jgi:septal ring factor EnvC (AmiA/AmiB activator)